jgi:DNA-binding XRE family transcriptional regulator
MENNLKNSVYKHSKIFAENLKSERVAKNLTQKRLASSIGITTQS